MPQLTPRTLDYAFRDCARHRLFQCEAMRRIFAVLTLIPLLLATACKRESSATDKAGQSASTAAPATFVFARGADAQKLDPADIDDGESFDTLAQVLEGLIAFRPGTTELEPRLAESWEISPDGRTYTFTIRRGVRFHDGTPLTAETAAFSFRRQHDPSHPAHFPDASFQYWTSFFKDVEAIVVKDEYTLQFRLARPNAALLPFFASAPGWLVSPGAFERHGAAMVSHPVGTGPYRFVSWQPNQAVIYERNPDYWGTTRPGFERLVLRSIPLNSSRMSELLAGRIHGLTGIEPAEVAQIRDDPRFAIIEASPLNVGYLAFNAAASHLVDPEVRLAIAMAIDRAAIRELALSGYGAVADFPLPAELSRNLDTPEPIPFAPDTARALLQRHPQLLARTITLATFGQPRAYFPDPARVASLIRSDLERVGLRVEIVNRDFKSHLHNTRNGDFEMALLGWIGDTADPDNFLTTFFHSRSATPGSAINISFYRNDEMDTLLDDALRVADPAARASLYARALALWRRDLPLIPLVHGPQIVVLRREVRGYTPHPLGNHFFNAVRWDATGENRGE